MSHKLKIVLLTVCAFMLFEISYAQGIENTKNAKKIPTVERSLYKLHLITPGIGYEHRLGKSFTLGVSAYFTPIGAMGKKGYPYKQPIWYTIGTKFRVKLQGRYYYNFKARMALTGTVKNNSANYFSFQLMHDFYSWLYSTREKVQVTEKSLPNYGTSAGISWGLQRSYNNRVYIDLELGVGVFLSRLPIRVIPQVHFTLGYLLFQGKQK